MTATKKPVLRWALIALAVLVVLALLALLSSGVGQGERTGKVLHRSSGVVTGLVQGVFGTETAEAADATQPYVGGSPCGGWDLDCSGQTGTNTNGTGTITSLDPDHVYSPKSKAGCGGSKVCNAGGYMTSASNYDINMAPAAHYDINTGGWNIPPGTDGADYGPLSLLTDNQLLGMIYFAGAGQMNDCLTARASESVKFHNMLGGPWHLPDLDGKTAFWGDFTQKVCYVGPKGFVTGCGFAGAFQCYGQLHLGKVWKHYGVSAYGKFFGWSFDQISTAGSSRCSPDNRSYPPCGKTKRVYEFHQCVSKSGITVCPRDYTMILRNLYLTFPKASGGMRVTASQY